MTSDGQPNSRSMVEAMLLKAMSCQLRPAIAKSSEYSVDRVLAHRLVVGAVARDQPRAMSRQRLQFVQDRERLPRERDDVQHSPHHLARGMRTLRERTGQEKSPKVLISLGLFGVLERRATFRTIVVVERRRIELPTFALRTRRSPS